MSSHPTVKWIALALAGLLIAGAVAVGGSRLASRQIGLASEPIQAGDALAPRTGPDAKKQPAKTPEPAEASAPQGGTKPVAPSEHSEAASGGSDSDGDGDDD